MDALLEKGLTCLAVLDVSCAAIARAQQRLGVRSNLVRWIASDVTADWHWTPVDIWHDRATFHFLTDAADRESYRHRMIQQIRNGGYAIVATFAESGPSKCSGLPVVRYSADSLARELGPAFALVQAVEERHQTPSGSVQPFLYGLFRLEHPYGLTADHQTRSEIATTDA